MISDLENPYIQKMSNFENGEQIAELKAAMDLKLQAAIDKMETDSVVQRQLLATEIQARFIQYSTILFHYFCVLTCYNCD